MVRYLVSYYGTSGGSGISCDLDPELVAIQASSSDGYRAYHHAIVIDTADNGRSGAGGLGERHALGVESEVAVVVGEVEARHGGGSCQVARSGCKLSGAGRGRGMDWS